ncbi:hypothetical protein PanWU01x14_040590 [Parasponia andersonii]|uniref:Uncharacterized protein n=1 Tax=Parasponia andersonii TaxID=3476 RepID=A0A2P5DRA2_PARAD|nr:hypothetical protein PanWU01x14_040590 [Parasponia andersonii]
MKKSLEGSGPYLALPARFGAFHRMNRTVSHIANTPLGEALQRRLESTLPTSNSGLWLRSLEKTWLQQVVDLFRSTKLIVAIRINKTTVPFF